MCGVAWVQWWLAACCLVVVLGGGFAIWLGLVVVRFAVALLSGFASHYPTLLL